MNPNAIFHELKGRGRTYCNLDMYNEPFLHYVFDSEYIKLISVNIEPKECETCLRLMKEDYGNNVIPIEDTGEYEW